MEVRLDKYAIMMEDNPYLPPEGCRVYFTGEFYGHPRLEDGKRSSPSDPAYINREERYFIGCSGKRYNLDTIDDHFVEHYQKNLKAGSDCPDNAEDAIWDFLEGRLERLKERHPEDFDEDGNWLKQKEYLREYEERQVKK